jgi:hypothetical protein
MGGIEYDRAPSEDTPWDALDRLDDMRQKYMRGLKVAGLCVKKSMAPMPVDPGKTERAEFESQAIENIKAHMAQGETSARELAATMQGSMIISESVIRSILLRYEGQLWHRRRARISWRWSIIEGAESEPER